jgi:hypothetical protein
LNVAGGKIQTNSNKSTNTSLYAEKATVTVTDGIIYAVKSYSVETLDSTLNISGGTIYNGANSHNVFIKNSTLDITGGTFYSEGRATSIYSSNNSVVTISGGIITNAEASTIDGNRSNLIYNYGSNLTIEDGASLISKNLGNMIYSTGNTIINGGSFQGDSATYFQTQGGQFTIAVPLTLSVYQTLISSYNTDVTINGGTYTNRVAETGVKYHDIMHFSDYVTDDVQHTATLNNVNLSSDYSHGIFVTGEQKLVINGGSYTATASKCNTINIEESGEVYIYGGTFNNTLAAVFDNYGTLEMHDSPTASAGKQIFYNRGTLIIDDGNYHLDSNDSGSSYLLTSGKYAEIKGGTFVAEDRPALDFWNDSETSITGGTFTTKATYAPVLSSGNTNVSGTSVFNAPENESVVELHGGNFVIDGGTYNGSDKYGVFRINEGLITVNANLNIENALGPVFGVSSEGALTVNAGTYKSTAENGVPISTSTSRNGDGEIFKSVVNITGGTFISAKSYAFANYGTGTITGGNFTTESTSTNYTIYNRGELTISGDVNVVSESGKTLVYNDNGINTFNNVVPELTISGGNYTTVNARYFINRGIMTINNLTLEALTSTLLDNFGTATINGGIYSNETGSGQLISQEDGATLYLNDGTYRSGSVVLYQIFDANTYIDTGTYISTSGTVFHNQGNLNISNAHVESPDESADYLLYLVGNSETTISNSELYAHGSNFGLILSDNSKLTVESGKITAENGFPLYLINGTATFNGGEFSATNNSAALFQDGTYNLNAGRFSGGNGKVDLYKTANSPATINIMPDVIYTTKNW